MSNVKEILLKRIEEFNNVFSEILIKNGYQESSILIERLECFKMEFPSNPAIEVTWKNNHIKYSFTFRLYDNYFMDFEFFNSEINKKISLNDYKRFNQNENIEIYKMSGDIKDKYKSYLIMSLDYINSEELLDVLKGKKWFNIPFDWQNQK